MSNSIHSADRATHLKIVVVAPAMVIAIAGSATVCSFKSASIEAKVVSKAEYLSA